MKKIIILLASCLLLFNCEKETFNIHQPNSLESSGLLGQVKSITDSSFDAIDSIGIYFKGKLEIVSNSEFNLAGLLDVFASFDQRNSSGLTSKYTYDSEGRMLSSCITYTFENADGCKYFKYEKNGNHLITECYNQYWNWYHTSDKEYDINRLLIKEKRLYKEKDYDKTITYSYNNSGYLVGKTERNESDSWEYKFAFKNDDRGHCIEERSYYNNDLNRVIVYKYDSMGNCIDIKQYDELGKRLHTQSFSFSYDSLGNWIEKTTLYKNHASSILKRDIEYY